MIKAFIFDMDGVIVNSVPMYYDIYNEIFSKRNIIFNKEIFTYFNGMKDIEIANLFVNKHKLNEKAEEIVNEKNILLDKYKSEKIQLFNDAKEVISKLKALDYKIGLATSSDEKIVDYILNNFNIRNLFDNIVNADMVKNSKPSPDIFLQVSDNLCIANRNCIVIEDSINGINAARNAGMKTVAVTTTSNRDIFCNADLIIDSLSELLTKLDEVSVKCAE